MKYILVSGGVVSGVGKGIIASSVGLLVKSMGLSVTMIKIDPYINVDAGTMAPTEHGEVFVLDDGGEADLDLGNYERYLGVTLTRDHNITTGKVYQHVIQAERRGEYLGRTVQIVPDLVDAIAKWIEDVAEKPVDETNQPPDVCVVELGGTAGDMENAPFLEALRRLRRRVGKDQWLHVLVTLVPLIINDEPKTKPTQAAMRDVLSTGHKPDLIACRCEKPLADSIISKVASSCDVETDEIIVVHNVSSTYLVPALLESQGLLPSISKILRLDLITKPPELTTKGANMWADWKALTTSRDSSCPTVTVALVGKYTGFMDSYISVLKSLEHSVMALHHKLNLVVVDASHLEKATRESSEAAYDVAWAKMRDANGIIVPGGFGFRGSEGMIAAAQWARESKTPYLGICLGMQLAVIEYTRNVCNIPQAGSIELTPDCPEPVIIFMPEIDPENMGGTMRLGSRTTVFQEGTEWSKMRKLYGGDQTINERHRHRYEVNPDYVERLEAGGLHFIGKDEAGIRMEIIELKDHPWFVGVQYHPEYLSRVLHPSRPYFGLVSAAIAERKRRDGQGDLVNGADGGGSGNGGNGNGNSGTLNPACAPGGNFDLSFFNLQLPTGAPDIIKSNQLQGCQGYTGPPFFTDKTSGEMILTAPGNPDETGCVTTSGREDCRTELREVENSTGSNAAWSPQGTNTMTVTMTVIKSDNGTYGTAIGQVFASEASKPLAEMYYSPAGDIVVGFKPDAQSNQVVTKLGNVPVGTKFTYKLNYSNDKLSISINGKETSLSTFFWQSPACYFNAGNYNQGASATSSEVHMASIQVVLS